MWWQCTNLPCMVHSHVFTPLFPHSKTGNTMLPKGNVNLVCRITPLIQTLISSQYVLGGSSTQLFIVCMCVFLLLQSKDFFFFSLTDFFLKTSSKMMSTQTHKMNSFTTHNFREYTTFFKFYCSVSKSVMYCEMSVFVMLCDNIVAYDIHCISSKCKIISLLLWTHRAVNAENHRENTRCT